MKDLAMSAQNDLSVDAHLIEKYFCFGLLEVWNCIHNEPYVDTPSIRGTESLKLFAH
jgi:hypothetical protein